MSGFDLMLEIEKYISTIGLTHSDSILKLIEALSEEDDDE